MNALIKTVTLGCKVNQYETEFVRQAMHRVGYRDAGDEQTADVCVVNTCTVTAEGDSKSRQIIRRLHRENPDAQIVVMGCYATRASDEVARLPGVTEVIRDKRELPDFLGRFGVIDLPNGLTEYSRRHRAYIKVQDGCALRCTYCIIPYVRPNLISRPVEHIVDETQRLVEQGFREIILTGIHLGHYGLDWNRNRKPDEWVQLTDLVDSLARLPGKFRVRLSSIEATEAPRRLIDAVTANADRIAPHFHLCLQSGSDSVLRRMRRRWSTKLFVDRCDLIRQKISKPAITTDVIVGFPGETDTEFEETMKTCRDAGFSKMHIFPFSARRGTEAAEYPDQVAPDVKLERVKRLTVLEQELQKQYFESLMGETLEELVESRKHDGDAGDAQDWQGTSCRYANVVFRDSGEWEYELVPVKATSVERSPEGNWRVRGVRQ